MTDSSSDCEEREALIVLISDLLRRLLPDAPADLHTPGGAPAPTQHPSDRLNSTSAASRPSVLPQREEAAQTLWDLTASATCARITVECFGLEILPEIASHALSSTHHRLAELSLGIMANIICHAKLAAEVITHTDLTS